MIPQHYTPATPMQQLMWAGQARLPHLPLYNSALAFTIHGALDPGRLQAAFESLVLHNEALRLTLTDMEGEPTLASLEGPHPPLQLIDCRAHEAPETAAEAWMRSDAGRTFVFGEHLYRSALLRLEEQRWIWYLNQHHVITDAHSVALLWKRLASTYSKLADGCEPVDISRPSFTDFARLLGTEPSERARRKAEPYWRQKLAEPLEPTSFYGRTSTPLSGGARRLTVELSQERLTRLAALASDSRLGALNTDLGRLCMVTSVLLALAHRLSGKTVLRVGFPHMSRPTPDARATAGLFLETAALQVTVEDNPSFLELARAVRSDVLASLRHLPPGISSAATGSAFDLQVNCFRVPVGDIAGMPCRVNWVDTAAMDPSHSLRLQLFQFEGAGELTLYLDVAEALFGAGRQKRLKAHFERLLDLCLAEPENRIGSTGLNDEIQNGHLVHQFNTVATLRDIPVTTAELLTRALRRADPEALAVSQSDGAGGWTRSLNYRELVGNAVSLANRLQDQDDPTGGRIAICTERSVETVVAAIAAVLSGHAFLPLDPSHPHERLHRLIRDSDVEIVLTQSRLREALADAGAAILEIDRYGVPLADASDAAFPCRPEPTDCAYIMHTSGSTGQPKGVMIEQHSLANYLTWANSAYATDHSASFPLYTSLAFDLTLTSLLVPLLSAGTIRVYPEQHTQKRLELLDVLRDDVVEVVKLTPSHLRLALASDVRPARLHTLVLGGEDLKRSLALQALKHFGDSMRIYNEYGPTEATVGCMWHRFDPAIDLEDSVPVGRPISGARVYVLDRYGFPAPTGVTGEIHIGGHCVARGYLDRPELSRRRFVPDLLDPRQTMYRSGDLARWSESGRIEYLGRADNQVKVGGVRVELGEIETQLMHHPEVSNCVVTLDPGTGNEKDGRGQTSLIAYYVAAQALSPKDLRRFLSSRLPTHALPARFVALRELPVNANGKIDHAALPRPAEVHRPASRPPGNAREAALVKLWQQVLELEDIGTDDDFFELGGDSMACIRLVAAARRRGYHLSLGQLFRHPTIVELAAVVSDREAPARPAESTPVLSGGGMSALFDEYAE